MQPILQLHNLTIGYSAKPSDYVVQSDINLQSDRPELIALIGINGIGKSTLLKTITGFYPPLNGNVYLLNRSVSSYPVNERAGIISIVTTESISVDNLNVYDVIATGRYTHTNLFGKLFDTDKQHVDRSVELLEIGSLCDKFFNQLSDGERQKVMIARCVAQNTTVIILDEPTAHLDLANNFEIILLLKKLAENGKTILFSTHDISVALRFADRIWLMHESGIADGSPEDLVLSDCFTSVFKNRNIRFDTTTGNFTSNTVCTSHICLTGEGLLYEWTKNALERTGYKVINESCSSGSIKIIRKQNKPVWIYTLGDINGECTSIYDLVCVLKQSQ